MLPAMTNPRQLGRIDSTGCKRRPQANGALIMKIRLAVCCARIFVPGDYRMIFPKLIELERRYASGVSLTHFSLFLFSQPNISIGADFHRRAGRLKKPDTKTRHHLLLWKNWDI
jgi:hypothetical protein